MPAVLARWIDEEEISALVNAHFSEFMVEQILLDRNGPYPAPEAEEFAQLQLILHQLARARLEVDVYTEAINKALPLQTGKLVSFRSQTHSNCC
jgi:hypothetical protein